jgi:hypothetical protein
MGLLATPIAGPKEITFGKDGLCDSKESSLY